MADDTVHVARHGLQGETDRQKRAREINALVSFVGDSGRYHTRDTYQPAATRAAVVLSAVGCDWRED